MANNADETKLIPTYVESDFRTSINKVKQLLSQEPTFKDFNYHGSNIAMIIELLSYLADTTNFYTNMVAKNVYLDTADIYETVHRLVRQKGYVPLGWLASEATINLRIESPTLSAGDDIVIPAWQSVVSGLTTDDGQSIEYTLTQQVVERVTTDGSIDIELRLRQGTYEMLTFRGEDVIDNIIILPFRDYDSGMYPYEIPSVALHVNNAEWLRVHDFYDHISGLIPDERDIYTFYYDKYKRYIASFTSSMTVPAKTDTIDMYLLRTYGDAGIIAANTFSTTSGGIGSLNIYNASRYQPNSTERVIYSGEEITLFENPDASVGGSDPETVNELKNNADANMHTQFRNVTQKDYKFHLEMRSDVTKGAAWGEQEVDPGNTIEYNKVYTSVIPRAGNTSMFMDGTLETEDVVWEEQNVPGLSATVEIPTRYTTAFENNLLEYLEPRKMISVYEFPTIPVPIYFRFDIGIRTNRAYNFIDVKNDVQDKVEWYFNPINREFNEEINFMDLHNFVYDYSIVRDDDYEFPNIKGLDNFVMREISTYTHSQLSGAPAHSIIPSGAPSGCMHYHPIPSGSFTGVLSGDTVDAQFIYEPNVVNHYPQYTQEAKENYYENHLRPIKLGYNQFPLLSLDMTRIFNEGT